MACFHPLSGWKTESGGFTSAICRPFVRMQVPCGQCIGCRLQRSLDWAVRCMHEAQLHEDNCFITLTYDDAHLPVDGSLVKHHFQDFMKRLRRRCEPIRFKYFMCGEYGERLARPHYHACLFGLDFKDRELFSERGGVQLFVSPLLAACWQKGFCTVGDCSFESAAYVARYCVKKVNGEKKYSHYVSPDGVMMQEEYTAMSRGGRSGKGLAFRWYEQFSSDVFPSDECYLRGRILRPPRYYQKMYQVDDAEGYEALLAKRQEFFVAHQADCTPERLAVREVVKRAQLGQLKRGYEHEA